MPDQIPFINGVVELVEDGGPFVALIFAAGILMWTIIAERYWFFQRVLPRQARELHDAWDARAERTSSCARQIRQAMISRLNKAMNAGLPVMQVLVPMSPLLGLIGTEVGALVVGRAGGRPIYLGEVARIEDGPEQPRQYVRHGLGGAGGTAGREHPAVTLAVSKKPGENAVYPTVSWYDLRLRVNDELSPAP